MPGAGHLGSRRFGELRELLPGVSEKVLTAQLRELEHDGIVKRLDAGTVPPRVDYMLSEAGQELIPVMEAMCGWGTKHLGVPPSLPRLTPTGLQPAWMSSAGEASTTPFQPTAELQRSPAFLQNKSRNQKPAPE